MSHRSCWLRSGAWIPVFVFLTAVPVLAAPGLNLSWNSCYGEGTGVQNMAFACNTNLGSQRIVGSFVSDIDILRVGGVECYVDLASASAALPAWWRVDRDGCRYGSLSMNLVASPDDAVCVDLWSGQALSAYVYSVGDRGPNTARISVESAVDWFQPQLLQTILAGSEYFIFNLQINRAKTVGADACIGCSTPACIVFNSARVLFCDPDELEYCAYLDPGGPNFTHTLTGGTHPGSDYVTWQGGGLPEVGGVTGCPAATSVRKQTWGGIKAVYR